MRLSVRSNSPGSSQPPPPLGLSSVPTRPPDASSQSQLPSAPLSTRSRSWPAPALGCESDRALPQGSRDPGQTDNLINKPDAMLGRHVFQQCSELRVGSGAWAGRAGLGGPQEEGPQGRAWSRKGQEGRHQPRHSGRGRAQGEGVVELGPWGTQGLRGGVERLGLAEPGMGMQQDISRVGCRDYGLAALCVSEGKMGGNGEHVWEFLGCSGLCPAIAVA